MSQREPFDRYAIRRIVWDGPHVETDEGRTIRGAVGVTYGGAYRAAEVSLHREYGPTGRVAVEAESYRWDTKLHAHKEHAIFAARDSVARTLKAERQIEIPGKAESSPAAKYGGNDTQNRSITPPSRSR
jgi:hypothetical protein